MKGITLTFVLLLIGISCSSWHSISTTEKKHNTAMSMKTDTLPASIRFSNNFRMLWDELQKETRGNLANPNYIPSEQLQKKYNFKYSDGKYYIKGYLYTQPDFNKNDAENHEISIVSYTDTLKSFSCPIFKIPVLINLSNISAIELNKSVKLR